MKGAPMERGKKATLTVPTVSQELDMMDQAFIEDIEELDAWFTYEYEGDDPDLDPIQINTTDTQSIPLQPVIVYDDATDYL